MVPAHWGIDLDVIIEIHNDILIRNNHRQSNMRGGVSCPIICTRIYVTTERRLTSTCSAKNQIRVRQWMGEYIGLYNQFLLLADKKDVGWGILENRNLNISKRSINKSRCKRVQCTEIWTPTCHAICPYGIQVMQNLIQIQNIAGFKQVMKSQLLSR